MNADDRVAPFFRRPREEAAYEGALGIVDPFVLVADHIVDGFLAPSAHAFLGRTGRSQEGPVFAFHQTEARIRVTGRRVVMEPCCRVRRAKDIADTWLVLGAI